jgi:hypothetical protein
MYMVFACQLSQRLRIHDRLRESNRCVFTEDVRDLAEELKETPLHDVVQRSLVSVKVHTHEGHAIEYFVFVIYW